MAALVKMMLVCCLFIGETLCGYNEELPKNFELLQLL